MVDHSEGPDAGLPDPQPGENASMPKLRLAAGDVDSFKDFGDLIRVRTLFFFPFYGAFLTFLFAKSQYIIDANAIIQIEFFATFLSGVSYAWTVAGLLSRIEETRLIMGVKLSPFIGEGLIFPPAQLGGITAVLKSLLPAHNFEKKLFAWSMYLLWLTTGSVLFDIFFRKPIMAAICYVAARLFHVHCGPGGLVVNVPL